MWPSFLRSTPGTTYDDVKESLESRIDGRALSDESLLEVLATASNYINGTRKGRREEAKKEVDSYLRGIHGEKGLVYNGERGMSYLNGFLGSSVDDIASLLEAPASYTQKPGSIEGKLLPNRPERAHFSSDEGFDKAFIGYQTSRMGELREKHASFVADGQVYHGTKLTPDEVFKYGIPAKGGDNYNIQNHQEEAGKSALRGACLDARNPAKFADEGGWVYLLAPIGGAIDVNSSLGERRLDLEKGKMVGSIMYGETEYAFGSRQPASVIKGAFQVGSYSDAADAYRLGEFVTNPGYIGGR